MRRMVKFAVSAAAIGGGAVAWRLGVRRQQGMAAGQTARLIAAASVRSPADVTSDEIDRLPPAVARYLRWALPPGYTARLVRIGQVGELRTDAMRSRWMSFEADHRIAPAATAFVWNARVTIAPLLHVHVRDAYLDGEGSGHVSLASAFTIARAGATPEMNSGALHRFLAEAVWFPTALLPSADLQWASIDAHRALATLTDRGTTVSLEFRFAPSGGVTGIYTPARWGTFDGAYRQLPWEGHFHNYRRQGSVIVPTGGDVGWYVDGKWRAVWRGSVTSYRQEP